MSVALLAAASLAFHVAPPVAPLAAAPRANARIAPTELSLAKTAALANLATFGIYGTALLLKPVNLMKDVMKSDAATELKFAEFPYAVAQYLGAVYLSQAFRCVRALMVAATMKEALLGVGIVQLFLCVTSLARLAQGLDRNSVTLTLPMGQGFMAALSFLGYSSV